MKKPKQEMNTPLPLHNEQLNIELTEEVAEGIYSNLTIVSHSHSEFVLDFINIMPNTPKSKVRARIIVTPQNMKRLFRAIRDNVSKYEEMNGSIQEIEQIEIPMNFGVPIAQA